MSTPEPPATHGAELVAPLQAGPDGSGSATCPVCRTGNAVPPDAGGWVPIRCRSCGTDFAASDGSPPPPPPPPPPEPPPAPERLFTHWVASLPPPAEGRWFPCPSCRITHVQIRDDEDDDTLITCPACLGRFRVRDAREYRHRTPGEPPGGPFGVRSVLWGLGSCLVAFLAVSFGLALLVALLTELFRRLMG